MLQDHRCLSFFPVTMLTLVTCLLLLVSGVHRGAAQSEVLKEKNDATEGPLPKVDKEIRPADSEFM